MNENKSLHLLLRITSCLQTILDLEPQLERLELGDALLDEFDHLKSFLTKVDDINLQENDVERIETATANFLEELKVPLSLLKDAQPPHRFLQ